MNLFENSCTSTARFVGLKSDSVLDLISRSHVWPYLRLDLHVYEILSPINTISPPIHLNRASALLL